MTQYGSGLDGFNVRFSLSLFSDRRGLLWFAVPALLVSAGCMPSTELRGADERDAAPESLEERCDRLDNDLDGLVDEDFKNAQGIYLTDAHCGQCNVPCRENEVTVSSVCVMTEFGPACRAEACIDGYAPKSNTCVPRDGRLCLSCRENEDCGGFDGAVCAAIDGEQRCTVSCADLPCPGDFQCVGSRCQPPSGSCLCGAEDDFTVACPMSVGEEICTGVAQCAGGRMGPCLGTEERCDSLDNDCNGVVDDPFVDAEGFYSVDIRNCGACGVDCTLSAEIDVEVICGGPKTSPVCAIRCEDEQDGVQVGDALDADFNAGTGCECVVQSLEDRAGFDVEGTTQLDGNCDGADGDVKTSLYVVPSGSDDNPGTPLMPMGTLSAAMEQAVLSHGGARPITDIFVAAGAYREVVVLADGVRLHGGYRPDFRVKDPESYVTEVYAPSWDARLGGAALVAENVGIEAETTVSGFVFRGASSTEPQGAAFGAYLSGCGERLQITDSSIHAGSGGDGENGSNGLEGAAPTDFGGDGAVPSAAEEDEGYACITGPANRNLGGTGGSFQCGGVSTDGGDGGSAACPEGTQHLQENGQAGAGHSGLAGGNGGGGGWDATAPLVDNGVQCGPADLTVSGSYEVAEDGATGRNGTAGTAGNGCRDPLGAMDAGGWNAENGDAGGDGTAGTGGGGGGGGGSASVDGELCSGAPDGIGGGGGGGGAGGCGGNGGGGGESAGPSVGVFVLLDSSGRMPAISNNRIYTADGGDGGDGGHGGDGGAGGRGGSGGELRPLERTTVTLSGASSGGHGGRGGTGGRGGGGGGGCGGAAVGIWVVSGAAGSATEIASTYRATNDFNLGKAGPAGAGGFGGIAGQSGAEGAVVDVHVD